MRTKLNPVVAASESISRGVDNSMVRNAIVKQL